MTEVTGEIPLLVRTLSSAPLGIYGLKQLTDYAFRLGYRIVGVAERESLASAVALGQVASRLDIKPLYALEVFVDSERCFPVILLALNSNGFRQLLRIYSALSGEIYLRQGLSGLLLGKEELQGKGLAGFVEIPSLSGAGKNVESWHRQLRILVQGLPYAEVYLRLPVGSMSSQHPLPMAGMLDLANQTGLSPIVFPVGFFADKSDALLYTLGRQVYLDQLDSEGIPEAKAALPLCTEEYFRSNFIRSVEFVEKAGVAVSSALENARQLVDKIDWRFHPESLHPPALRPERGFNPETRLWDRIHEAAQKQWPDRISEIKERLYEEFSALKRQDRMGFFLALCELFHRLSRPDLVSIPDRATHGLLCAYLVGINPFDPVEQQQPFQESSLRSLCNPLVLHIPDGWQDEILRILQELFGHHSVAVIERRTVPSPTTMRSMASRYHLEDHPQAINYLRICGASPEGRKRWAVVFSRQVDQELPCQPEPGLQPGSYQRLGIPVEHVLNLPCLVFEIVPDPNKTRLWNLGDQVPEGDPTQKPLTESIFQTLQEIIPILYPRYNRSVIWLTFHAIHPTNWSDLVAVLAMLELERHDRAGFQRAIRTRLKKMQGTSRSWESSNQEKQGHQQVEEILDSSKGLFLFRDQLQPLFEKVLGLSHQESFSLARRILGTGTLLPTHDDVIQEVIPYLDNPELSYLTTQFLSLIPRYLCSQRQIADWAKNLVQFGIAADNNPLDFARVTLDEALQPRVEIAALQLFLEKRGKRLFPPDVNQSEEKCKIESDGLRLGLSFVENIGPVTSEHIRKSREGSLFYSLENFLSRTHRRLVNRRVLRHLTLCGALDRFGGRGSPEMIRPRILEKISTLFHEPSLPYDEDPQTYLFDLGKGSIETEESSQEEWLASPVSWVEEEAQLFGVPLSCSIQRAMEDRLPFELSMEIPSRRYWWLGRAILQAGVLKDVWPWLESKEKGMYTLATLHCGAHWFLVVADSKLRDRLVALASESTASPAPASLLALARLGGRPKGLDRLTLGLLPQPDTPKLFHQIPHLYLQDFEALPLVIENSRQWRQIEVTVDQVQRRLISHIRTQIHPFRVEPLKGAGAFLRFKVPTLEFLPTSLRPLEKIPLLPCQMLLRQLESLDGIRSARFVRDEQEPPLLRFK